MDINYAKEEYFKSFHQALDQVAREQIYIEMIEARPFQEIAEFQKKLITNNWPVYYAINNGEVIGWADISLPSNPRLSHRGFLGMGLLRQFRGKGLGTNLLNRALDHAKNIGIEKVELTVYTNNMAAIGLYKKCSFTEVGVIKHYRKLNGQYFDCLEMEKFL